MNVSDEGRYTCWGKVRQTNLSASVNVDVQCASLLIILGHTCIVMRKYHRCTVYVHVSQCIRASIDHVQADHRSGQ